MSKLVTSPVGRGGALRNSVLGMAVATALALPQIAAAYEFDLGSEDLSFRWDNTLRLNIADRVAGQNKDMIANPNYDDGDRNFNTGSIWTRFDVLSEMDLVWKPSWGMLGARVSRRRLVGSGLPVAGQQFGTDIELPEGWCSGAGAV